MAVTRGARGSREQRGGEVSLTGAVHAAGKERRRDVECVHGPSGRSAGG